MSEVNRSEFQVLASEAYHHGEGIGVYTINGVRQLGVTDVLYEKSAYDTLSSENNALREALEKIRDYHKFEVHEPKDLADIACEALGKVKS